MITEPKDIEERINSFQEIFTKWYPKNIKEYLWRNDRTPYRVLISEYFLIRTKAYQVEPIFMNFLEIYPSLEDFLNIDKKIVKELMNSLGLHKRIDMLKTLSEQIKEDYNDTIPKEFKDLKSLMGIGNYTANAILCFAYNEKRPLLDKNIVRFYERVFNVKSDKKKPENDKELWDFSEKLLPNEDFINYNYGILDLCIGICKPKKPECENCPINNICLYYKEKDST